MHRNTSPQLDSLIEKLQEYQRAPSTALSDAQSSIILLAEENLVDEDGQPIRTAIARLRQAGFDVVAKAIHGSSWVGPLIKTRNGSISFG